MATVLDTTQDCTSKASALRGAGYTTVIRYYSVNAWKRMGAAEAQALSHAGLTLGAVYQDRQNQPADFSLAKGTTAGKNALHYAQSVIMQPAGSAIYFSACPFTSMRRCDPCIPADSSICCIRSLSCAGW